ncbi:hypothetical protein IOQ59_11005 [Pontibacterium sp. N1Y112]|uniref:Uncharacterized protein n=1 Tax=Pontibacterium sinense TaxID=2781979 RepID=A0A8J7FUX4_9GAMM|nr:hypothetical protein [Pontibacterium sinense]MBE9397785.1 hypothetical protein [Pontibacterium sinense]
MIRNLLAKITKLFSGIEFDIYYTQQQIEDKIVLHSNKLSLIEMTVKSYKEQLREIKMNTAEKKVGDVRVDFDKTIDRLLDNGIEEHRAVAMTASKLLKDGMNAAVVDEIVSETNTRIDFNDLVRLEGAVEHEHKRADEKNCERNDDQRSFGVLCSS